MWSDWHLFEPVIHRMAGLGVVTPQVHDDFISDQVHDRRTTLVVDGGAAGLAAARGHFRLHVGRAHAKALVDCLEEASAHAGA